TPLPPKCLSVTAIITAHPAISTPNLCQGDTSLYSGSIWRTSRKYSCSAKKLIRKKRRKNDSSFHRMPPSMMATKKRAVTVRVMNVFMLDYNVGPGVKLHIVFQVTSLSACGDQLPGFCLVGVMYIHLVHARQHGHKGRVLPVDHHGVDAVFRQHSPDDLGFVGYVAAENFYPVFFHISVFKY